MEEKEEETATLAKAERAPIEFTPRNLDEAWRMSDVLSKAQVMPDALRGKPNDLLVTIMTGAELGLSPMQSVRNISVVKGKGYLDALLKVALVKQSPVCEYLELVTTTATKCVYKTKRRGEGEVVMEYTIDDAKAAGLASNDNYTKRPKLMLRRRCASEICDEVYPDIVRGLDNFDDAPVERELNTRPAQYAPPGPSPVDAEVVKPTPPPAKGATVVDHPAKAKAEAKNKAGDSTPPADPSPLKGTTAGAGPATSPVPAEPLKTAPLPASKAPDGLDAIGITMKLADAKTLEEVDALIDLAQKIQGPERTKLKEHFKAARARIEAEAAKGGAA